MLRLVAFALGSNLNDRVEAIRGAVHCLIQYIEEPQLASFYETAPYGVHEQPTFVNTVLVGRTRLEPMQLLVLAKALSGR
mgnify:CR=1 FL=1